MKPFGIEIEKKANILSLVAFLLSLSSILYQLWGYMRGPDVRMFPPDQVLFMTETMGKKEYMLIIAPMTYVNKGQAGYNAVLKEERVSFTLKGKKYEQKWVGIVNSSSSDSRLKVEGKDTAHPMTINAGSAISHETKFSPRSFPTREPDRWRNFLVWDDFLAGLSGLKELELEFVTEIYGERPEKAKCKVILDSDFIKRLQEKKWSAPSCWTTAS